MKKIFLLLSVLASILAEAHYIWIEAPGVSVKGKPVEIKIFYGEYENQVREVAGKRLEDVKGIKVFISGSDGKKTEADLIQDINCYRTTFTPASDGIYTITAVNTVREVVDWRAYDIGLVKPEYFAFHTIKVGTAGENSGAAAELTGINLKLLTEKKSCTKGNKILLDLAVNGQKSEKGKLMIYAPNGWMKELERTNGQYEFIPEHSGLYLAEFVYKDKTPGVYKEKFYEAVRKRFILSVYVE